MLKWKRIATIAVAGSALMAVLAGCAGGAAPAAGQEPIKLGLLGAWSTGVLAFDDPLIAARIAAQAVNDDGGVNGRPIEIVAYDTKGDPAAKLAGARKLIEEDGVVALLGGDSGDGVGQIGTRAGVVNWFPMGSNPADLDNPLSYITAFNSTGLAQAGYLAATTLAPKSIAFVTLASEGPYIDQLRYGLQQGGFDTSQLQFIEVPFGTTDFSAAIARLKDLSPDVWMAAMLPENMTAVIQAAAAQGITTPFVASNNAFEDATAIALSDAPFPNVLALEKKEDARYSTVWAEYIAQVAKYNTDGALTKVHDGSTTNDWFAVWSFAQEARTLDTVTRESFRDHVAGLTDFDYDVIAPLDLTVASAVPGQPRQNNAFGFQGYATGGSVALNSPEAFSAYLDVRPPAAPLSAEQLKTQTNSGR